MRLRREKCARCGGPLNSFDAEARCAYCESLQPQGAEKADLRRTVRDVLHEALEVEGLRSPARTRHVSLSTALILMFGGALVVAGGILAMFLWTSTDDATPVAADEQPVVSPVVVAPTPRPPAPVIAEPPGVPVPPTVKPPPEKAPPVKAPTRPPPPRLTKEAWAKQRVAARSGKLLECVEQDLLHFPEAPKAYTVTLTVQRNKLPLNSETRFTPEPSKGFYDCARFVIYYGFKASTRSPAVLEDFTVTTRFAFPNAKPAKEMLHGHGWD